jgi:hypothetical protein
MITAFWCQGFPGYGQRPAPQRHADQRVDPIEHAAVTETPPESFTPRALQRALEQITEYRDNR